MENLSGANFPQNSASKVIQALKTLHYHQVAVHGGGRYIHLPTSPVMDLIYDSA